MSSEKGSLSCVLLSSSEQLPELVGRSLVDSSVMSIVLRSLGFVNVVMEGLMRVLSVVFVREEEGTAEGLCRCEMKRAGEGGGAAERRELSACIAGDDEDVVCTASEPSK
jgi:hypothetical protein